MKTKMKTKILLLLVFIAGYGFSQTSQLVNHDYPYTALAYYNSSGGHYSVSWNNFPDFNLPDKYILGWMNGFSYGDWEAPLHKGFTHTNSYNNQLNYQYNNLGYPYDSWQSPRNIRLKDYGHVNADCYVGWVSTQTGPYNDLINRYQYKYIEGGNLAWNPSTSNCDPTPPLPYNYPSQTNLSASFVDSSGTIVPNFGVIALDFEAVQNLEYYYGRCGLDGYLACVQNPSCSNPYYQSIHPYPSEERIGMPSSFQFLPFQDFKKEWFKAKIAEYYAPFDAYHRISQPNKALIGNYSTNMVNPCLLDDTSVTWAQVISNPDFINYMFRDTATFTTLGNHLYNAMDYIGYNSYTGGGNYTDWTYGSGTWLQSLLFDIEFTKAWDPNKTLINWYWMKTDYYNQASQNYWAFKSPEYCEAHPIFALIAGSDGFMIWDGENGNTNQHHYEYLIKGMHRMSHFNHFLEDSSAIRVMGMDPIQIGKLDNDSLTAINLGVWRGIVSGDSILVAAMNPYAPNSTYTTDVVVNYSGWSDTITLVGREVFLGSARWNANTTQIKKVDNDLDFNIFPNPATDELNIKIQNEKGNNKLVIEIYSATGEKISQTIFQQQSINVSALAKGFYMIKLKSNGVVVGVKTFIKE